MENIGDDRPVRPCGYCAVKDDHPRCLATGTEPGELAEDHHLDCGRRNGCAVCVEKTAGAEDLRGGQLLAHLLQKEAQQ